MPSNESSRVPQGRHPCAAVTEEASVSPAPGRSGAPAYRPDIDGLRALAVISVLLFHIGIPGFDGGYVGVDVFFVISGYLITRLLEESRDESARHQLAAFYLRRMRRILPALLATCLVTAVVAVALFTPDELVNVGKFLAATPVMLSNVASWTRGDYFAPGVRQLPLSHLWSISVEEQFYLIYPLLLIAIARYRLPYRRLTLIGLASVSLALCIWASHHMSEANYVFAPTRAWELLLGATLAMSAAPRIWNRIAVEGVAAASLLGIVVAVHLYTASTRYPGTAAILPCVATAALLATGSSSRPALVNRMLSWRPLVFVGLISYSLYLWHQPMLVFVNYYYIAPLTPAATAALLAATLLVATASWRFIERPVRARILMKNTRTLLVGAGVGSAGILVAGLVLWNSDGFPQRFPPETRSLIVSMTATPELVHCVEDVSLEQVRAGRVCNYGPGDPSPKVLLWGDSHALALMPAVQELAKAHGMHAYFVAKYNCLPLFAPSNPIRIDTATDRYGCATFNSAVLEAIARLQPELIILDGAWAAGEPPAHVPDVAAGIEQTVNRVSDHSRSICVVFAVPMLKYAVSHALFMSRRRHIPDDFLSLSRADALAQHSDMEHDVRVIAQRSGLKVADPKDALCPANSCLYKADDRSLYFDDSHLSVYGALYAAPTLEPCFATDRRRRLPQQGFYGAAGTNRIRVISDGTPKRFGGPQ
jgi:peptidoglycan/LPS O-acetylase OafA/YrhL